MDYERDRTDLGLSPLPADDADVPTPRTPTSHRRPASRNGIDRARALAAHDCGWKPTRNLLLVPCHRCGAAVRSWCSKRPGGFPAFGHVCVSRGTEVPAGDLT